MKLAVLLMIHKNLEQIKILLTALEHQDITIFIHADKKMKENLSILKQERVVILPKQQRQNVKWAQISQVNATINLLKAAKEYGEFDYYWLCSGQDFPIKSSDELINFLNMHLGVNYINFFPSLEYQYGKCTNYDKRNQIIFPKWLISRNIIMRIIKRLYIEVTGGYQYTFKVFRRVDAPVKHFFFGATWWCLHTNTVNWLLQYLAKHPEYYKFFEACLCPDESFFHTLVMMSPYKFDINDYLHYIDWSEGKSNPKTLLVSDYEPIINSDKMVARKFDVDVDREIINKLVLKVCKK